MIWIVEPPLAIAWAGQNGMPKTMKLAEILVKDYCPPGTVIYFMPGEYQMTSSVIQPVTSWTDDFKSTIATIDIVWFTFCIVNGVSGTPDAPVSFIGLKDGGGNPPEIHGDGLTSSIAFDVNGSHLIFRNFNIIGCNTGFKINALDTVATLFTSVGIQIRDCVISDYGTESLKSKVQLANPGNGLPTDMIRLNPQVNAYPPSAIYASAAVRDLTISNCYFHDLGSNNLDDLYPPEYFKGDPDPDAYIKYYGAYLHYFAHGHALYLFGSGHKITDCRFESIAQGWSIKCDEHWAEVDPLIPGADPVELPSQLDSTMVPWASHLIQSCQFTGANAPGWDSVSKKGVAFPGAGPASYISAYGSHSGPPPLYESTFMGYDKEGKEIRKPTPNYNVFGANIAIVDCDFMGSRDHFAAVDLPPGGGWPPPDYAKIALVACRLYCAPAPSGTGFSTIGGKSCTGAWTYGDATGINFGSAFPDSIRALLSKEDWKAVLEGLGWANPAAEPAPVYFCQDFIVSHGNHRVTLADWGKWFAPDLLIMYSDKRAYQLHLNVAEDKAYGRPYPSATGFNPNKNDKDTVCYDWHTLPPDGNFGNAWNGLVREFSYDNVPDHQDFFTFDGERRWTWRWLDKPWQSGNP
jgi:hypothetical protein